MEEILEIAKKIQENMREEAQAIVDYTELLKHVKESQFDKEIQKAVEATIKEIVSDELNHEMKLRILYSALTEIKPNKD